MTPQERVKYLERLVPGLEQTIQSLKFELPYYKPDDLQGIYAKKFLASVEENLERSRLELEELKKSVGREGFEPPTLVV